MGNDGGSIPDRRDLVRNKPKAEQADKANQTRAKWLFCALSKRPLQEPVVSCALGKLYNKDAIIEFLIDRTVYGDGEKICGHIRSLKDVKTLKLTPDPTLKVASGDEDRDSRAQFICPMNMKQMNGSQPFVYIWTCGCVFSQAGLKSVSSSKSSLPPSEEKKSGQMGKDGKEEQERPDSGFQQGRDLEICPQCATKYNKAEDVITLNPSAEEEERLWLQMERRRLAEPMKSKNKKRKAAAIAPGDEAPPKKKAAPALPSTNPSIAAASRAVVSSLAMEEAKRKAQMSDAIKSLYDDPRAPKKKETFMTMGTFTRYA